MIKIERSPNPPASLAREAQKSNGSGCYNGPDVMQALNKDFFGKCYICELKPLQDPVVEHLFLITTATARSVSLLGIICF